MKIKRVWKITVAVAFLAAVSFFVLTRTTVQHAFGFNNLQAQPYVQTTGIVPTGAATTSEFGGDVTPNSNNIYSLGTPVKAWRNVYASGTLAVGSLTSTGTSTAPYFAASQSGTATAPAFTFTGDSDTGIFNEAANQLSFTVGGVRKSLIDGTANYNYNPIVAGTTNFYDVGSPSLGWRNIYSSSTIFGVNSTMTGTSTAGPYLLADNAGMVTGMDMTITSALANGGDAGYQLDLNNDPYMDIYGRYDSGVVEPTSTAIRLYHNLLGMGGIDIGTSTEMGAGGFVNVYASGTLALGGMSVTSTIDSITSTTTKGTCLALQDVAGGTRTYCTAQGGTLTCGTTSCK